jgi:hypothetical protein
MKHRPQAETQQQSSVLGFTQFLPPLLIQNQWQVASRVDTNVNVERSHNILLISSLLPYSYLLILACDERNR